MADDTEIWFERGVPDGLPIVPPTRERVECMLAGTARGRAELVAPIVVAGGTARRFSAIVPGWMGGEMGSRPVARAIGEGEDER